MNNLDVLKEGGVCVAIVPMSCAVDNTKIARDLKRKILEQHTLEGVMSMPEDLFHGQTNVVTCTMVITAHKPHPEGKKTWFGYWRNDGFVKVKHRGRVDKNHTWENTKSRWVNAFRNREVIEGFSLAREVKELDEWCAEAYMVTDYSKIEKQDFEKNIKEYLIYKMINEAEGEE